MAGRLLTLRAPAKVNLFLEVLGKRRDGYHELATLFAKVGLYDDVTLRPAASGVALKLDARGLRPGGRTADNLCVRAARAFFSAFPKVRGGVAITLRKRIPVGAGLGGGSSDAAAVLLGLRRLYRLPDDAKTRARLRRIAVTLGADVPFFLEKSGLCAARGIGEKLRPVAARGWRRPLVVVYPKVKVATAAAYRGLRLPDRRASLTALSRFSKLKEIVAKGGDFSDFTGLLFNRFEATVPDAFPRVAAARSALEAAGLSGVLMSGSGSAVFGFAADAASGRRTAARMRRRGWAAYLVEVQWRSQR